MKLFHRILAAMLGTLLVVVLFVTGLWYVSVERGFAHYVESLEEERLQPAVHRLEHVFEVEGSWDGLAHDPARFGALLRREGDGAPPGPPARPPPAPSRPM